MQFVNKQQGRSRVDKKLIQLINHKNDTNLTN